MANETKGDLRIFLSSKQLKKYYALWDFLFVKSVRNFDNAYIENFLLVFLKFVWNWDLIVIYIFMIEFMSLFNDKKQANIFIEIIIYMKRCDL